MLKREIFIEELKNITENIDDSYSLGDILYTIFSPLARKASDLRTVTDNEVISVLEDVLSKESPEE